MQSKDQGAVESREGESESKSPGKPSKKSKGVKQ
jgi:hypothetical protein